MAMYFIKRPYFKSYPPPQVSSKGKKKYICEPEPVHFATDFYENLIMEKASQLGSLLEADVAKIRTCCTGKW